jgi:hypothetical protein
MGAREEVLDLVVDEFTAGFVELRLVIWYSSAIIWATS